MRIDRFLVLPLVLCLCGHVQAADSLGEPSNKPAAIKHVVLLGIDGLSVAGLSQAQTPNLDALSAGGVYLNRSRGVMPTKSSPNWASILTGVYPSEHGIHSNQWWWFRFKRTLGYPTIFTALKNAKPDSEAVALYEWKQFGRLFKSADLKASWWVKDESKLTKQLSNILSSGMPTLTVVHMLSADTAGHEYAWMSDEYIAGVEYADGQVGEILEILKAKGNLEETLIVVATDHGGVGKGHGGDSATELYTPVIFSGPGIKKGLRLHGMTQNVDITATLYHTLGITPVVPLKGIPLKAIWE